MAVFWYTSLITTAIFCSVRCANILAILPIQAYSHFQPFSPLLEKLAERGHEVDVLSNFPRANPMPRYNDLNLRGSTPIVTDLKLPTQSPTTLQILQLSYKIFGRSLCEAVMKSKVSRKLMKSRKQYDLIIIEMFLTDCMLGYLSIFKAPIIAMSSTLNLPWASDLIGLPDNPAYIPSVLTAYTENMQLLERLHNAATLYMEKVWYNCFALEESDSFIAETFGNNDVHVRDRLKNISLLMVNSHYSIHQSRPLTPNFIEVAGIHINPNQTLLKEYEGYLETDLQGIVFLSFGTYLRSEKFPEYYIVTLLEVMKDVPYKILWRGERAAIPNHIKIPKNVHFVPWLPQVEILCHPSLKLFISHCGLASIQETFYCGKPILGIPVWIDQLANANNAISKGIGISVPFFRMTKQNLMESIKELLNNSTYAANAVKLSEIFRDRPMSPLDSAVYWTEYVIRYKGAKHLRPKAADLPWYTYYCVDIIAIPSFAIVILAIIVYKLLKILKYRICEFIYHKVLTRLPKRKTH